MSTANANIARTKVREKAKTPGLQTIEGDLYDTPNWVTEFLLGFITNRPGSILEPADGVRPNGPGAQGRMGFDILRDEEDA